MALTSERVSTVFFDCLFRDDEDTSGHIPAKGIVTNVGFHPGRITDHKGDIVEMLGELPDQFHETKGGGWSFLNACQDRHGNQWTDLHQTMEQLFLLGIGAGLVKELMPEMRSIFPGGMPYYVVLKAAAQPAPAGSEER
jgi:hypothetical protein